MIAPTVAVTCQAADQSGQSVAGAVYTATLNQTEISSGLIAPESVAVVANSSGVATLNLWPNALGTAGSLYRVKATNPANGKKFFDAMVRVPNAACFLHQIIMDEPTPALDSAQQALADAQALLAAGVHYYGALAANPTANPLGGAVVAGDLYFNTVLQYALFYTGMAWERPAFESAAIAAIDADVLAVDVAKNTAINTTIPGKVALVDAAVAATAAGSATAAMVRTEAARDQAAAATNARASTAVALADASISVGASFTAPLPNGSFQAYIKTSTSVATAIGLPFASSADVLAVAPAASLTFSDSYNGTVASGSNEFNHGAYLVFPVTRRGKISALSFNSVNTGSLTVVAARKVQGPDRWSDVARVALAGVTGTNTFADPFNGLTLEAGDWIGFVCAAGTPVMQYAATGGTGLYAFASAVSTALAGTKFALSTSTRKYMLAATVTGVEVASVQLSATAAARLSAVEQAASDNAQRIGIATAPAAKRIYRNASLQLSDLAFSTGLAVHGSGGLVAATDGVAGVGALKLPFDLDNSKPWQVTLAFVVGASTSFQAVTLRDSVTVNHAGPKMSNLKVGRGLSSQYGFSTGFNGLGFSDLVADATVWWSVACDGMGTITESAQASILNVAALATSPIAFAPAYQATLADKIGVNVIPDTHVYSSTIATYGSSAGWLNTLQLDMSASDTRLIGIHASIGGFESYSDGSGSPAVIAVNTDQHIYKSNASAFANGSQAPLLLLPRFRPAQDKPVIHQQHPNASQSVASTNGPTLLDLLGKGYALSFVTGGYHAASSGTAGKGYESPTSSCWAGATGMAYRYRFEDWVNAMYQPDKYALYGESMGLLNSLTHLTDGRPAPFCIVGISGVTDLTASLGLSAFTALINAGYGDVYVSLTAANTETPSLTAANWRRIGNRQRAASAAWAQSPYAWRDAWVAGTYAANDIVFVPSTSGATVLKPRDPSLNASRYLSVPVYLRHGTGDTLVPSSQATNFQTAVNALGGNVTVDFIAGAGHIAPACYSRTAEVAFIESCR